MIVLKPNQPDVKVEHLLQITPATRYLLIVAEFLYGVWFKESLVLTSIIRLNSKRIHRYGRAFDTRIPKAKDSLIEELMQYVNWRYPYDLARPQRPTVFRHNTGRGDHLHWQTFTKAVWYEGNNL